MKLNLRLTTDNVGDIIDVATEDLFKVRGELISVGENSFEVRDAVSHALFTIYIFEISKLVIIENKEKHSVENVGHITVPKKAVGPGAFVKVEVEVEKIKSTHYDHPTFGRLTHNEGMVTFLKLNAPELKIDQGICKYIVIKEKNEIYEECIVYLKSSKTIGLSFYESNIQELFKYIVLSCPSFSMLIDLNEKDSEHIRELYHDLFALLIDEQYLKVVYGGPNLFFFFHKQFNIQLNNFIDLQIFHYGLHNIRVTEPLRQPISYTEMVELLFNIPFKMKGKAYFTTEDVLNKLAFNTHFLIPIYNFILNRLLDPVKIISNRVCRMNIEELESDAVSADLHLVPCSYDNFDILPRSLQFWTYRDTSSMLQAKKIVDTELHTEKQEFNKNASDVIEINKNFLNMKEKRDKIGVQYYEKLSEDEDDEIQAYEDSNVLWRSQQHCEDNIDQKAEKAEPKKGISRLGRGRGLITSASSIYQPPGNDNSREQKINDNQVDLCFSVSKSCETKLNSLNFDNTVVLRDVTLEGNHNLNKVRCGIGRGSTHFKRTATPSFISDNSSNNRIEALEPYECPMDMKSSPPIMPFGVEEDLPYDNKTSLGRGVSPLKNLRPSINGYADNFSEGIPNRPGSITSSIENMAFNSISHKEIDYCELPQTSWNKNRVGKLSLEKYNVETIHVDNKKYSEAQGILWNEVSVKGEEITDSLYKQFGLQ